MAGRRSSSGAHAAQADQQGQQQQPEGRPKRKAAELTLQRIHAQVNGSRAATTNQDAAPDADTSSARRARGRPRRSATGGVVSTGSSSTSGGRDGAGAAAPTAARAGTKGLHDYRPRRMEIGGKAPRKLLSAAAIRKLEKAKQKASEVDEEATFSKRARTTSTGASTVSVGVQCDAVAVLDEEHITCHVCMEVMHRPTMLVPCGHMACRSCIVAWVGTNTAECSMCRTRTSHITESYEMRAIIATYLESHPEAARSAEDVAAMIRKEDECKDRAEAALREVRRSTFLRRFPAEARVDNDYARRVKMAVDCVFRPITRRSAQGVAQAGQGQAVPAAAGDGPVVAPAVVLVQRRAAAGAAAAQP